MLLFVLTNEKGEIPQLLNGRRLGECGMYKSQGWGN